MGEQNKNQENRITKLETNYDWICKSIKDIKENHLLHIQDDIKSINKKLNGRPTWVVTTIISFLIGLCGVLITYALNQ